MKDKFTSNKIEARGGVRAININKNEEKKKGKNNEEYGLSDV